MKYLYSLLLFLSCAAVLPAQEKAAEVYQWPVEGKQAGEGVLFRPQDYIETEHNFGELFIAAAEGTNVLSPCDGTVVSFGLQYYPSLTSSMSLSGKGTFREMVDGNREEAKKRGLNANFFSVGITIQTADGRRVHLAGLNSDRAFATGQKVKRGEVLGKVHYCYHKIPRPCLMVSISKGGNTADPMSPFGLQSTFIAPVARQPKDPLTREEATADYRQLAAAVKEIYPSLEDFMTEAEYDRFVDAEIAKIPESISLKDFARMMMDFNRRIHDSHLWLSYGINTNAHRQMKLSPLLFGKVDDAVRVISTTGDYQQYQGREIVRINNKPVETICAEVEKVTGWSYDANVQSFTEHQMAAMLSHRYFLTDKEAQQGEKTTFTFADGEELTLPLGSAALEREYCEPFRHYLLSMRGIDLKHPEHRRVNYYHFMPNDSTAYLRLKTFHLMETEADSVAAFIRSLEEKGVNHLIIDLSFNGGGHTWVLDKLVNALLDEPRKREGGYSKVNMQTLKTPTLNWVAGERMFEGYKERAGRKGFYLMNDSAAPADTARREVYKGRLYVITNAYSASASSLFAGIMKRNGRGYIVGRETLSAYHTMTALKFADIQLANSLFKCHIPMVRIVSDEYVSDAFPKGRGVIPHLNIPISYEEIAVDGNLLLTKTLELIAKGIYL